MSKPVNPVLHPVSPGMLYILRYTCTRACRLVIPLSRHYSLSTAQDNNEVDNDMVLKFPSRLHLLSYCKSKTRERMISHVYALVWEP